MSYRTFKHLLGETSLERKCRFLFGAGILLLIVASFYLYSRYTERLVYDQNRNTGQLLVGPIIAKEHWEKLDTASHDDDFLGVGTWEKLDTASHDDDEFRALMEEMFGDLVPEKLRKYQYRLIDPYSMAKQAYAPWDDFERDALRRFQSKTKRTDEIGRLIPGRSEYQYIAAIRCTPRCLICHSTRKIGDRRVETHVGDLMAAMSVNFPQGKTEKEINGNRALLISTALVTAILAMAASYIIIRYVIVKPVKHLKDVSDAISSGNLAVRSEIHTGDEFEELSHAFNRMLRNLGQVQDDLRRANTDLDHRLDELAQANMALFEMNRLKSDFLATMSHELRTPLNSIIGFSEVLASSDRLNDRQRKYAQNIQTSGKMLLALINDILDLAKIESGKMEVRVEEFSIRDVCEGLTNLLRPMAERKNIDLSCFVDPMVPVLRQDAGKIQQVLYNLLSNAIKFTPEGGRVALAARAEADRVVLAVADTGVGIAEEDHDKIFEKFRQGIHHEALTREYTGTGLGLSIVRELTKLLGGDVSLESQLGKGSVFTIRLPVQLSAQRRFDVPLAGEHIDLSKARRIETRVAAVVQAGPAE